MLTAYTHIDGKDDACCVTGWQQRLAGPMEAWYRRWQPFRFAADLVRVISDNHIAAPGQRVSAAKQSAADRIV